MFLSMGLLLDQDLNSKKYNFIGLYLSTHILPHEVVTNFPDLFIRLELHGVIWEFLDITPRVVSAELRQDYSNAILSM
jgi:hypothetical protein